MCSLQVLNPFWQKADCNVRLSSIQYTGEGCSVENCAEPTLREEEGLAGFCVGKRGSFLRTSWNWCLLFQKARASWLGGTGAKPSSTGLYWFQHFQQFLAGRAMPDSQLGLPAERDGYGFCLWHRLSLPGISIHDGEDALNGATGTIINSDWHTVIVFHGKETQSVLLLLVVVAAAAVAAAAVMACVLGSRVRCFPGDDCGWLTPSRTTVLLARKKGRGPGPGVKTWEFLGLPLHN